MAIEKPIIYYVCGYQSCSQRSPKFHYLQQALSHSIDIKPFDYPDSYDPNICLSYFTAQVNQ